MDFLFRMCAKVVNLRLHKKKVDINIYDWKFHYLKLFYKFASNSKMNACCTVCKLSTIIFLFCT